MITPLRQRFVPPSGRRASGWLTVGVAAALLGPAPAARADAPGPALRTGASPIAVAVDPVADKIYLANNDSNNVTVIDGAGNTTTPVAVGSNPNAVAVDPVAHKIYVANSGSNNVTV